MVRFWPFSSPSWEYLLSVGAITALVTICFAFYLAFKEGDAVSNEFGPSQTNSWWRAFWVEEEIGGTLSTPTQNSSVTVDLSSKKWSQIALGFLIPFGMIAVLVLAIGVFFAGVGTLFFDNPNVSYSQFITSILGIPLLVVAIFAVSGVLYARRQYKISALISGLFLAVVIGWLLSLFVSAQARQNALNNYNAARENPVHTLVP